MFDLIVIGGGTAGVAAAYTAGNLGLKTIVIEKKNFLGGEMTGGLVVPMMDTGESSLNRNFFNDLVSEMSKINAQIEFQGNKGWFNPHLLSSVLEKMLLKSGVTIIYGATPTDIHTSKNKILSVLVNSCSNNTKILSEYNEKIYSDNIQAVKPQILSECIETRYVIDATGNCDFAKLSGCNFLENKIDENQLVSLRFCMGGVDIKKLSDFLTNLDRNREVTPIEVIGGKIHLSTAFTLDKKDDWALYPIVQKAINAHEITPEDVNYFQIFTVAGSDDEIAFNCPRFSRKIDVLDKTALSDTKECLLQSINRIAEFCKKYILGFGNAYISAIADDIGIRCSRRIKGKYIYTEEDLKSGKTFDNPVLEANYPIDVHSIGENSGIEKVYKIYQLPIESLMSVDFDNLFVAGRCVSADFKAQSALRVQQSCFSMGEGVAKYIARIIKQ